MSKSNFNLYATMGSIKLCQTLKNITDVNNLKLAQDRAREIMWDQEGGYKYGFNARGLSTIITMFSKLDDFKPSVNFLENWCYTAIQYREEFTPQELSNSIYAFGTLNIHPSKEFLEVWQIEAVKQIGNFNNQNLANSIYALSKLYSNDLNNMDDNKQEVNEPSVNLVDEHSNASASEFYRTNYLDNSSRTLLIEFLEVWKIATINKMNNFKVQELVNALSGFCKLDAYLNKSLAKLADAQGVEGDASSQAAAHSSSSVCGDSSTASLSQLVSEQANTSESCEINSSKNFLKSWEEAAIRKIYQFTPQGLANSVHAFSQLKDRQPSKKFLRCWQIEAVEKIGYFKSQELAISMNAFGKLKLQPSKEFSEVLQIEAINKINDFNAQGLVNIIYGFGKLKLQPLENFLNSWEKVAINKINEFNTQGLTNAIYAFTQLKVQPSKNFLNSWEAVVINKINEFNTQGLTNAIYAFTQLKVQPSKNFLNSWEKVVISKIDKFNAQELTSIIYTLGQLEEQSLELENLLEVWPEAAVKQMQNFSSQNLAVIICALGKLKVPPSEDFLGNWEKAAINKIDEFNTQDLTNIIYTFSSLKVQPLKSFLENWEKAAINKIDNFNAQGLANAIYAVSQLEEQSLEKFLEVWQEAAVKQITTFNSQNLANSIYAVSQLEEQSLEKFLEVWQEAAVKQITTFNSQNLANSMYALSQLKIQPSTELWEVWQVATIGKINEFTTQELTNSIYSLTILSALTQNNYLSTVKVLRDAINKLDFNQLSIEGVIQIWTGTNLLQALFNDQLLEEKKYKSISEIINSNPLNPMPSNLQESMFKVIANKYKGTPTKICSEYWIPELAARVDICVVFENNEKLVIQIDGPSHFIGNGKQHNAATEINTLFLNILDYTVVRIPYYDVDNTNNRTDILMQLFECIDNFTTSEEPMFDQHSLSNNSELFSEVALSAEVRDSSSFL